MWEENFFNASGMKFKYACQLWIDKLLKTKRNLLYTGCPSRNVPYFGRVFLMLNYTEKNEKHLYPKLNGYGDNGQRSLKLWQLLLTYW
jgi:hypothetical protein